MSILNFKVDVDKCTRCGACIRDCVAQIIGWVDDLPVILPEREEDCIGCQHCLAVCPTGAVSIFGLNPDDSPAVTPGALPSAEQMDLLIRSRRSIRQYDPAGIAPELLEAMLKTVRFAPTGRNDLGLTFTVVDNRADMVKLLEKIGRLVDANTATGPVKDFLDTAVSAFRNEGVDYMFRGAPHLLIATANEETHCPHEDIVIALTNFDLLAKANGVGSTWCGYLKLAADNLPGLREIMGLKPDEYFYAILFGKPTVTYHRLVQRENDQQVKRLTF